MAPKNQTEINHFLDNRFPLDGFLVIFILFQLQFVQLKNHYNFISSHFIMSQEKEMSLKKMSQTKRIKKLNNFAYKFENYLRYLGIRRKY